MGQLPPTRATPVQGDTSNGSAASACESDVRLADQAQDLRRRRREAESVLRSLIASKAECDRQMAQFKRTDAMETVRGSSALHEAIESTRQMIAELDRAIAASC